MVGYPPPCGWPEETGGGFARRTAHPSGRGTTKAQEPCVLRGWREIKQRRPRRGGAWPARKERARRVWFSDRRLVDRSLPRESETRPFFAGSRNSILWPRKAACVSIMEVGAFLRGGKGLGKGRKGGKKSLLNNKRKISVNT